jgi:polygalacturonase
MKNILEYGLVADGKTDFSAIIEFALREEGEIYLPEGEYIITRPVVMPSNTKIKADKNAHIKAADNSLTYPACYGMVVNENYILGNENIEIDGGIWDGNNQNNVRPNWKTGPCTGIMFNFMGVNGLTIKNVSSINSESYHFRLGRVENFVIENIEMRDELLTFSQDGIHVGGGCHHGTIRNILAHPGNPNDDLIAFNADDVNQYIMNSGMIDLPISDMLVENVTAENCFGAIRILSIEMPVENITFRNFTAGIREFAINCDAGRTCKHPIFENEEYPDGVGLMRNITFENFNVWRSEKIQQYPLCAIEQNSENVRFINFTRNREKDVSPELPFIRFDYLKESVIEVDGKTINLGKNEQLLYNEDVKELKLN